jgi:hypothetical protein
MTVNVCPSAVANAPLQALWRVLVETERYGHWADAAVVRADPPVLASELSLQPEHSVGAGARRSMLINGS